MSKDKEAGDREEYRAITKTEGKKMKSISEKGGATTMTADAILHRKLVAVGLSKKMQGNIMGLYREAAAEAALNERLDSPLQATTVEPKDITRDLSMMLQRLVVAIRKHAPEDSQLKHLGNLAWALLHDRGLSGSITRNTNTQGACDG